jgi:cobalt-precorrin-5B (C1)-methyltransferase
MKCLRYGFSTGTAATAAALGALLWLRGEGQSTVEITLPQGLKVPIPIAAIRRTQEGAEAWVIKDGGDDPDITSGLAVVASLRYTDRKGITLLAGPGVGRITRPGLPLAVGEPAINPGPRELLRSHLLPLLPPHVGLEVTLSIPDGEEKAEKTFNPRLGIIGGLSILGTRGLVVPMSDEALVATIHSELAVRCAEGCVDLCLVPGNYGRAVARNLKIVEKRIVTISNYIGFTLEKIAELPVKSLLVVGQVGKLMKVAGGTLHTHSRYSDGRRETFAALAAREGATPSEVNSILEANTLDEAVTTSQGCPWRESALKAAAERAATQIALEAPNLHQVGVVLFTLPDRVVSRSMAVNELISRLEIEP